MNRVPTLTLHAAIAAIILFFGVSRLPAQAQKPASPSDAQQSQKQAADEEEGNPFAPEAAPALPPGMTGSDVNDPRAKLTPGLYDAGEAAMGLKHLVLRV